MSASDYTFSEFLLLVLNRLVKVREERADASASSLPEDPQALHWAFYDLKRKYAKHFPLLHDLHFITAGPFPYSPELTEALDYLQLSGAITRENPSYERFSPRRFADSESWMSDSEQRLVGDNQSRERALTRAVSELDHALSANS